MISREPPDRRHDIDCVVFTSAIRKDNPEYIATMEKGIPFLTRAQLLGQLMKNYEMPIAISGTHGKTTTTSMVSEILLAADTDPTLSIGGILPSIGGDKLSRLNLAIDQIRNRYGDEAVKRARFIDNEHSHMTGGLGKAKRDHSTTE